MDQNDDFTFCQVGLPVKNGDFDEQNILPDTSEITLKDCFSNSPSYNGNDEDTKNENFQGNAGTSAQVNQGRKTVARKPVPRAKVPFEKGYSQMDWLKLTRLNGQSNRRLISMSEVKQHQAEGSMWTVLKGRVYNLSPSMKFHPGGGNVVLT